MINGSEMVAAIRVQGVDTMASLSGELSRLLDTSTHLSSALQGLSQAVEKADSAVSLHSVANRINRLQGLLQQWRFQLGNTAIRGHFRTVDFSLGDLRKIVAKFRMIAMQSYIEIKADTQTDSSKFTDDLRATPVEISTCVAALKDSAQKVQHAHDVAFPACEKALQAITTISEVIFAAMSDVQADRDVVNQAKRDVGTVIDRFQNDTRKHSVSIISSFQFSDFFAQRLDHIAQLLAEPPPRSQACSAIAKAQIAALVADGQQIVHSIHAALEQISLVKTEFSAAYGDHERNVKHVIEGQQSALARVMQHRDDALAAIGVAFSATGSIHHAMEDAQQRFKTLRGLSGMIDMAAINARLRSNRMANAQQTMAVLSSAVLETANECRDVMADCAGALEQIAKAHSSEASEQLQADVLGFRDDFDQCEAGMGVARAELAQLAQMRSDVMDSLSQLDTCLAASFTVAERLSSVLQNLSAVALELPRYDGAIDWPDLSDIMAMYTMESERAVHRAAVGLPESALPTPSIAHDLEAVFF